MKKILVLGILSITGCTTSHTIGNLQNDCDPGFLSPSVCLVTASVNHEVTQQYPISGTGFLGIAVPAAAQVGGAALIGNGLSHSGSRITNNNLPVSQGGKGLGGSATGGVGGAGGTGLGGSGGSSNATGGAGGSSSSSSNAQGGSGGQSFANSDASSDSTSKSQAESELDQHINVQGGCHGNCD